MDVLHEATDKVLLLRHVVNRVPSRPWHQPASRFDIGIGDVQTLHAVLLQESRTLERLREPAHATSESRQWKTVNKRQVRTTG